jgi:peptide/nickel transport system permease protein
VSASAASAVPTGPGASAAPVAGRLTRRPPALFVLGGTVVALVILMALLAPFISPYDPSAQVLEQRLQSPSWQHPMGLDELGRDILSRLIYGTRVSVAVGLSVVILAGLLGTFIGSVAGFIGGKVDTLLMRLTDVFFAFPGILLAIALVAVLGPALRNVVFALVVIGWTGYARLVRGQVLQIRSEEFVLAAETLGLKKHWVMIKHILPNVLPTLLVQASLGMAGAILAEAGLSFLGLGIQPPTPSWGAMINAGRSHLLDAPHLTLFPGIAILVTVMGLNFLGDSLIEWINPHARKRS